MVYRIYVEKKAELAHEANALLSELNTLLGITSLKEVRILNRYDADGITEELFNEARDTVFSEPQLDIAAAEVSTDGYTVFAVEYLPGQFDQRADSAAQCIQIMSCGERPTIRTAKVYLLAGELTEGYGISGISHFKGLDIKNEMLRIIELGKRNGEDSTRELIGILNEIMFKMREHSFILGGVRSIEQEMKDFLDTRVTSKFKIDDLCRHISRSESQTIRIFKKAYGITPYTYVLGKKTDLAKKLLCDTNLSVKEIADKLCFADEYYFSNVFKKRVGVTPSAYRRQESLKD